MEVKESDTLAMVSELNLAVDQAEHVDQVICALHSLAVLLFHVDSSLLSGSLGDACKKKVIETRVPTDAEREVWRRVFYQGAGFATLTKILLYKVASNWLACFPISARVQIYDSFFVNGPSTEVVQALVPSLVHNSKSFDHEDDLNAVCDNVERILVLCLLQNQGAWSIAKEFSNTDEDTSEWIKSDFISRMAQLITSIPDKARLEASASLSAHTFFKQIIMQILDGAEQREFLFHHDIDALDTEMSDGTLLFTGETFARICRRGFAGILVSEVIPRIVKHVRRLLTSTVDSVDLSELINSNSKLTFWQRMIEAIKDPYAVERLSEDLLRQLSAKDVNDIEAYWTLWILFYRTSNRRNTTRTMLVEKFLLWKVFPIRCLRWILRFSVLKFPPNGAMSTEGSVTQGRIDVVKRLVGVWSKREFIQLASMSQQAYITAAVGLLLENMSKEELETAGDLMHCLLQGVSCRLESPLHLVRRMASSIALVFSRVVDPKNPLLLDDDCSEVTLNWDFSEGKKEVVATSVLSEKKMKTDDRTSINSEDVKVKNSIVGGNGKLLVNNLVDPDEVIDPAFLNDEHGSDDDDDDNSSNNSEASNDSSLQPYDMSDDDTDLKKGFSQLGDLVTALRKSDDPNGVERALNVAENLLRSGPDELQHVSGELVRALVQLRCSDVTLEGEEESAEEKRQKALVAMVVSCPFKSLDALSKLLYSPNVDVSQRIMILDVMADAANELCNSRDVTNLKHQRGKLISSVTSEVQPWYRPSSRKGPLGAGSWKEVSERESALSWSHRYERELPSKVGDINIGKSRRWGGQASIKQETQIGIPKNKFPMYAAAFMLPVMQGYDKKRHGVDLLGQDFVVLGKLIYMLGVCMRCTAMHPEASALAPALLDMLSSREVSRHAEAYVRRSALFAASCILVTLHPSYVASALAEGNPDVSKGLDWIRTWALHIAETDPDTECASLAMTCLQLHSEMALQTFRSMEIKGKGDDCIGTSSLKKATIIVPRSNTRAFP
ncbi:hypothetical protein AMTRI_Chr06g200260 [Amborella trichopoda]